MIPALAAEETYRYLGVPIGLIHNVNHLPDLVDSLIPKIQLIRDSLAQVGCSTYIYSALSHICSSGWLPYQKITACISFMSPFFY